MILLGLAGKKQSGKSTAALSLFENHGFICHAFASPLKRMLQEIGIDYEACEDATLKERTLRELDILPIDITVRKVMQTLGTEWGRNCIHPQLWGTLMQQQINQSAKINPLQCVTDIRFEDEAYLIRNMGGTVVHIKRPGTSTDDSHTSEQGIDFKNGDITINNDGDLSKMYRSLSALVWTYATHQRSLTP